MRQGLIKRFVASFYLLMETLILVETKCIFFYNDTHCLLCSSNYYQKEAYTEETPFPLENCVEKTSAFISRIVFISGSAETAVANIAVDAIYSDFFDAFEKESLLLKVFVGAKVTFYLPIQANFVSIANTSRNYFRGQNTSISVLPLPCSLGLPLCVPLGAMSKIFISGKPISIFSLKELYIKSIYFIINFTLDSKENYDISLFNTYSPLELVEKVAFTLEYIIFRSLTLGPVSLVRVYEGNSMCQLNIVSTMFYDLAFMNEPIRAFKGPEKYFLDRNGFNMVININISKVAFESTLPMVVDRCIFCISNYNSTINILIRASEIAFKNFVSIYPDVFLIKFGNFSQNSQLFLENIMINNSSLQIIKLYSILNKVLINQLSVTNILINQKYGLILDGTIVAISGLYFSNLAMKTESSDMSGFIVLVNSGLEIYTGVLFNSSCAFSALSNSNILSFNLSLVMIKVEKYVVNLLEGSNMSLILGLFNGIMSQSYSSYFVSIQAGSLILNKTMITEIYLFYFLDILKGGSAALLSSKIENVNKVFCFVSERSLFKNISFIDLEIKNNAFFHFTIFLTPSNFAAQSPCITILNVYWFNHTMNSSISEFFSAFSKTILTIKNCKFLDLKRLPHFGTIPYAIFFVTRESYLFIQNTSFVNCGYTYVTIRMNVLYNYPLFFISLTPMASILNSFFSNDDSVSIMTGFFIITHSIIGEVSDCIFEASKRNPEYAYRAGGLSFVNSMKFTNNVFKNMECKQSPDIGESLDIGTLFFLGFTDYYKIKSDLLIRNISVRFCFCFNGGAALISNINYAVVENCFFSDNKAVWAGALYFSFINKLYLKGILGQNNAAINGPVNYFESVGLVFIESSSFFNSKAQNSPVWIVINVNYFYGYNLSIFNSTSDFIAGWIYAQNSNIYILETEIEEVLADSAGGVIYVDSDVDLSIENSISKCSKADSGGFLYANSIDNLIITNTEIFNSTSLIDGGSLKILRASQVSISKIYIAFSATTTGIIFLKSNEDEVFVTIDQAEFYNNYANIGTSIYFDSPGILNFYDVRVSEAQEGEVISAKWGLQIEVNIENLWVSGCFSKTYIFDLENVMLDVMGIYITETLGLKNLFKISNCNGDIRSLNVQRVSPPSNQDLHAYLLVLVSKINFEDFLVIHSGENYLIENVAKFEHSTISMQKVFVLNCNTLKTIFLSTKSNFIGLNIFVDNVGGNTFTFTASNVYFNNITILFSKKTSAAFPLYEIVFKSFRYTDVVTTHIEKLVCVKNESTASVWAEEIKRLTLIYSALIGIAAYPINYELRGLDLISIDEINILNSIFFSLFSLEKGSALVLSQGYTDTNSKIIISGSKFQNCEAPKAGAFYVYNQQTVIISDSKFDNNIAYFQTGSILNCVGGVAILICADFLSARCEFIVNTSVFTNNFAYYHSPLISSTQKIETRVAFKLDNKLENNTDGKNFTDSINFYPVRLYFVLVHYKDKEEYVRLDQPENDEEVEIPAEEFQSLKLFFISGVSFKIFFRLKDSSNNTLKFDDFSSSSIFRPFDSHFDIVIEKGLAKSSKGEIQFKDIMFRARPGSEFKLSLTLEIPADVILNEKALKFEFKYGLWFFAKSCKIGEIILPDMTCSKCPHGYYLMMDPMNISLSKQTQKCLVCLENAFCPGGSLIFPTEKFWRWSEDSMRLIECLIPEACLGWIEGRSDLENSIGVCAHGHYGNLCNDCIKGYSKLSSMMLCEECEEYLFISRIIIAIAVMVFYVAIISYSYSIQKKEDSAVGILFIYSKIFFSFIQTVSLVIFFKFKWILPTAKKIFNFTNSIFITTEEVLLTDCFWRYSKMSIESILTVKLILIVMLPFMMFFLMGTLWIIFHFNDIKKVVLSKGVLPMSKDLIVRIFASFIVSIFMFHPLITKSCFNFLNCVSLSETEEVNDDDLFLFFYPNFKCWTSIHYKLICYVVAPTILLWGVVFPIVLYLILEKQQKIEANKQAKVKKSRNSQMGTLFTKRFSHKISHKISIDNNLQPIKFGRNSEVNLGRNETFKSQEFIGSFKVVVRSGRKKKTKQLSKILYKSRIFDFLRFGYREQYPYWECFMFLKKFLISVLINLQQILGFNLTVLLITLTLSSHLLIQLYLRPFISVELNILEAVSITISFSIFVCAVNLSVQYITYTASYLIGLGITLLFMVFVVCFLYYVLRFLIEGRLLKRLIIKIEGFYNRKPKGGEKPPNNKPANDLT